MPDIGLLQGPPRPKLGPKLAIVTAAVTPAIPPGPEPEPEPALAAGAIRVAAHASVVSDRQPVATLRAPLVASDGVMPPQLPPTGSVASPSGVIAVAEPPAPTPMASAAVLASVPAMAHSAAEHPATSRPETPPAPSAAIPPIRLGDLLWLLLGLLVIIGTGLGIRDPWPADEPRFASLARDMAQTGEWLFPRVGGDLYQDKPPLFFWLLALSHGLFGAFKGWFLIPSLFAAAGVLFLIYDFGRRTVSRESGLAAAIITLCTLQFVLAFRGAQIDPTLCLLTTF